MPRPRFAPGSVHTFPVKNRSGKKSLACYLGSRIGVVDAWAEDLIAAGCVSLDGNVARSGENINLSAGPHVLEVRFPEAWPRHMAATEMPLDILHEDNRLLVLNKPPGIVVHPARGHLDNQTLQNGVRHRYRHLLGQPGVCIGSPHRLDKDTSGAIIFALDRPAYIALTEQFAAARPHKEYLAILDGKPDFDETLCDRPIGNDPDHKGRGCVTRDGKSARTHFRILERGEGWALALAIPHTGRPHQIRIHAASLGTPLAGDRDYNPRPERLDLHRQALHAAAIAVEHPDGGTLRVEAPLAEDLRLALETLRRRATPHGFVAELAAKRADRPVGICPEIRCTSERAKNT